MPLFADVPPEQLELVAARLRERPVIAGTEILVQGGPAEAVFVIVRGSVKVFRRQPDGDEVILAVLGEGELVGEMDPEGEPVHATGVATLEDSFVLWCDRASFAWMVHEVEPLRWRLVALLARRLRAADDRVETLAALDVEGRVARVLLDLANGHGEPKADGGIRIRVPLTQSDIAAMTGASRVRVNQVLTKFRSRGWITLDGRRRLSVRDAGAVQARCR
jgi:CRP-like cAMP-binding protein